MDIPSLPAFRIPATRLAAGLLAAVVAALPALALAQSSCSSDGEPVPVALLERFINADCETCWSDRSTPKAARGTMAVDWVVPGIRGDDAPLAVVATRDGLLRLDHLGRAKVLQADAVRTKTLRGPQKIRVARGLPFNGYMGASVELRPAQGGPWTAWLLLVETLPAGVEDSPVERNLVRNALRVDWPAGRQARLFDSRPMAIPEGAKPDRLRAVGWVEDGKGKIRGMAQSRCKATP